MLQTAVSDLEVESKEKDGSLWHLKYPLEDGSSHLVVATTRPETMLGDTGVAVHPDDERYKDLVGKNCIQPLTQRRMPIVADEYADPDKGSGAVKITPGHDFNDFAVGKRHKLAMINVHRRVQAELPRCKMILQVDDELIFEVPDSELEQAKQLVKQEMEATGKALGLSVPLKVDLGVGCNWRAAHP